MGVQYFKRPTLDASIITVQGPLTGNSTGTVLKPWGLTLIKSTAGTAGGSGGNATWILGTPLRKGMLKHIAVQDASTKKVNIRVANSTLVSLLGTTLGVIQFTTGAGTSNYKRASLVSVSTSQWLLLNASTGVSTVA